MDISFSDLDTRISSCPKKEIVVSPDPSLAPVLESSMSCMDTWNKCSTCLIVQDEAKGINLKQEIMQALQISDIKVITLHEAADLCSAESLNLIWVHVPIPVQEDMLASITSLRYCSKENRSAYFIAITDTQSDVDLQLHGFDEVYLEPIPKDTIHHKYQKLKFVPLTKVPSSDNMTLIRDTTSTPESTISLESVRTTEYSQSSTCDSVSSGMDINDINICDLKSSLIVPLCSKSPFLSGSSEKEGGRSPVMDPLSPSWCKVEHATKEKQRSLVRKLPAHTEKERRERIKDSCDQLRVLLPYVKGRKTDMASILEMTVDYLKIVNAALPQDFQSHVIDIMSNGNSLLDGRLGAVEKISMPNRKMNRRRIINPDTSPLGKPLHIVEKTSTEMNYGCSGDQTLNNKRVTKSLSRIGTSSMTHDKVNGSTNVGTIKSCNTHTTNSINGLAICKRECPIMTKGESSKAKRPHIAVAKDEDSPTVIYLPTGSVTHVKESKKENILNEVTGQGHHVTGSQFSHLFTEGDASANRMFSSNMTGDMFPYQNHAQMNTPMARVSGTDRGDLATYGGMYFDGTFYHYFSPVQDSNNGNYFHTGGSNEYVNPNAVIPMTSFTPRTSAFNTSRKFDRTSTELDRFGLTDENSDLFNNNCGIAGVKPNNA